MSHQIRVMLGFTNAPDYQLEETAGAVINGLTAGYELQHRSPRHRRLDGL
jgi:hypothetical protein